MWQSIGGNGNQTVASIEGFLGNSWLARQLLVDETLATNLMTHAIQEMGYLSEFLSELYVRETAVPEIVANEEIEE